MPFPPPLDEQVDHYARSDLGGDLDWHIAQFPFLADDSALQQRVGEEFFTARYLYKLLEGVHRSEQWALSAQARLQVLQYASIYEACLHHVLFQTLNNRPQVSELGRYSTLKEYDVPPALFKSFEHDGRQIVTAYMARKKAEISKIKFEDKVRVAVELGAIRESLGEDLKTIYEARNSIHLHAELKKQLEFDLDFGRFAYRRMQPFCEQLIVFIQNETES